MISRALTLKPVLFNLCDQSQFNKRDGVRLRRYIIQDKEWDLLQELWPLLDIFLFVTKEVSTNAIPCIYHVIPFMDGLFDTLDDYASDRPAVRMVAKRGLTVLKKYYGKTDESTIFHIAMILHPAYKLDYFRSHGWPEDWIATTIDILQADWVKMYKPNTNSANDATRSNTLARSGENSLRSKFFRSVLQPSFSAQDALDVYLATPTIPSIKDPLRYWQAMVSNRDPLAPMSLDYLSTPNVERAFSKGRLTVSRLHHSLSDESTHVATILGSWADVPGVVLDDELVANIKDKQFRWAADAGDEVIVVD